MTPEELRKRQNRAETEPLIIAHTEQGVRVHSPVSGGGPYFVTGLPEAPECTCPDFQKNWSDPDWRCKHVLAVVDRRGGETPSPAGGGPLEPEPRTPGQEGPRMLLKRSVSPDGRIDSLSVELSAPAQGRSPAEIAAHAESILRAQDLIVSRFLNGSENGRAEGPREIRSGEGNGRPVRDEATTAELVGIRGVDGKWGRRLYMTIRTDEGYLRLYGSRKKLAQHLTEAGYPDWAGNVREGVSLNLPCRVTTRTSDDGYVSVERVLPDRGSMARGH